MCLPSTLAARQQRASGPSLMPVLVPAVHPVQTCAVRAVPTRLFQSLRCLPCRGICWGARNRRPSPSSPSWTFWMGTATLAFSLFKNAGWKSLWLAGIEGPQGGDSSGVLVLARDWLG
eukprot:2505220-Pyramimonas_sp.AAC.1